jgi:hypothetical protein
LKLEFRNPDLGHAKQQEAGSLPPKAFGAHGGDQGLKLEFRNPDHQSPFSAFSFFVFRFQVPGLGFKLPASSFKLPSQILTLKRNR